MSRTTVTLVFVGSLLTLGCSQAPSSVNLETKAVKEFKKIVAEVDQRVQSDPSSTWVLTNDRSPEAPTYGKWGKETKIYSDVRYDVEKTDSLVVPFVGRIRVKVTTRSYDTDSSGKRPSVRFRTEREARQLSEYYESSFYQTNEYKWEDGKWMPGDKGSWHFPFTGKRLEEDHKFGTCKRID